MIIGVEDTYTAVQFLGSFSYSRTLMTGFCTTVSDEHIKEKRVVAAHHSPLRKKENKSGRIDL